MADLLYPKEKFATAVEYLAASPASLQARIRAAFSSFMPLHDRDFEGYPELLVRYQEIKKRLTHRPDFRGEGTVAATLRDMDDEEAVELAKLIVDFSYDLHKAGSL